jgi:hypothetical protein
MPTDKNDPFATSPSEPKVETPPDDTRYEHTFSVTHYVTAPGADSAHEVHTSERSSIEDATAWMHDRLTSA